MSFYFYCFLIIVALILIIWMWRKKKKSKFPELAPREDGWVRYEDSEEEVDW